MGACVMQWAGNGRRPECPNRTATHLAISRGAGDWMAGVRDARGRTSFGCGTSAADEHTVPPRIPRELLTIPPSQGSCARYTSAQLTPRHVLHTISPPMSGLSSPTRNPEGRSARAG
jgi:hypothetical protein